MFTERRSLVKRVYPLQKQGMKLDRIMITEAALSVLQAEGLDKLAMRAVAAQLGVQASALYWHVQDKSQLHGLMAARLYRSAFEQTEGAGSAREWLTTLGNAFRAILLANRDAARLCAMAPAETGAVEDPTARLAAPLGSLGLSAARALTAIASVLSLTLGWVVYQQSEAMHDHLARMIDFDAAYTTGLTALVDGLLGNE